MPLSFLTHNSGVLRLVVVTPIVVATILFWVLGPDSKPRVPQAPGLKVAERFPLRAGATARGSTLATDGDSPADNTPVWFFRREGRRHIAQRLDFSDTRPRWKDFDVKFSASSRRAAVDIAEWPTGLRAFELELERGGVRSRGVSLGARGRVHSRGFARLPRPAGKRQVAVATWSGPSPDLFVIDVLEARERLRITIFSGESNFVQPIGTERAPITGIDEDKWNFDVAHVVGRRPSLVAFGLSGTGSKHPEIHVLSGDSRFRQFIVQRRLALPPYDRSPPLVAGLTLGRPSVFVVRNGRLLTIPFAGPR